MPFTVSHIAAVLPFARWLRTRHLLSAAIIGSMAPDFGILLPLHLARQETHGLVPLVTFVLPTGLLCFWLFQLAIKDALIEVLPSRAWQRARAFAARADIRRWQAWLLAAAGILVGALTHLAWDAFTHEGGRGMRLIPALDELTVGVSGHRLFGQRLLQDFSSLVGFAVIAVWIAWALREPAGTDDAGRPLGEVERWMWQWAYILVAIGSAMVALYLLLHDPEPVRHSFGVATNDVAIAGLRGLAASLVAVSLALDSRLRRKRRAAGLPQP